MFFIKRNKRDFKMKNLQIVHKDIIFSIWSTGQVFVLYYKYQGDQITNIVFNEGF